MRRRRRIVPLDRSSPNLSTTSTLHTLSLILSLFKTSQSVLCDLVLLSPYHLSLLLYPALAVDDPKPI